MGLAMGGVKEKWIREGSLGLDINRPEKPVCAACIEDHALQEVVAQHAEHTTCAYCGKTGKRPIAAALDEVTLHMANCIGRVYCDPAETLPYESREGGYQGTVYELYELFEEIGFDVSNDDLRDDIYSSFDQDYWSETDWLVLDPGERLAHGWKTFSEAVKHQRRFTFWSMGDPHAHPVYDDHPDNMPVGQMLDKIAEIVGETGILLEIPTDTPLWRIRVHESSIRLNRDSDLGAPPRGCANQPNRMSPAGISMFYGSEDFETAVAETVDPCRAAGKRVTGASFYPMRPLQILDLFDLPPVPSFFDDTAFDLRYTLIFLHAFARNVSQPITRDGREHIEYVPTQAFSEYVRYQMKDANGHSIDGIRFRSSRNGKACYVVFCENEQCIGHESGHGSAQLLKLRESSLRSEDAEAAAPRGGA